jgi:pimeloyl-ACP methyl ester carboxylesterase
MRELVKAFYKGGFHVVSIASPTHPSFMVAASESQVPGMPESDARDLYRVMRLAHERIADTIDITGVHLVGYSLGAAEAAYVAKLDDAERRLGFGRVLLINPPVSLYRTAEKLDGMIFAIPGGVDGFDKFFYEHFVQFATVYRQSDTLDFTDDFLYALYKQNPPEQRTFEALIGISFRMAAANMLFTADVLTHAGVVVPKERVLASTDSLTVYAKTCAYLGFRTYMDDLLLPALQRLRPEMTIDDLIAESGLAPLGDYLAATPRIGLMHNVDDPILTEGDLDFLRRTFAGRARIYLKGGHLGNLNHHRNVADMLAFLRGEWGGS